MRYTTLSRRLSSMIRRFVRHATSLLRRTKVTPELPLHDAMTRLALCLARSCRHSPDSFLRNWLASHVARPDRAGARKAHLVRNNAHLLDKASHPRDDTACTARVLYLAMASAHLSL